MKYFTYLLLTLTALLLLAFFYKVPLVNKSLASIHAQLELKVGDISITPFQSKLIDIEASHLEGNKKIEIASIKEIVIDYSLFSLISKPHTIDSIVLHNTLLTLEGALAAQKLDFDNDDEDEISPPPEENATGEIPNIALKYFAVTNLKFNGDHPALKGSKLTIPKIDRLSIKNIESKNFSSTSDMIDFLIKAIVKKIKGKKMLEGLLINTGLLPKEILKQGIKTPKDILNLLPKIIEGLDDQENSDSPQEKTPNERDKNSKKKLNDKLKNIIKSKKNSISHKNKKIKKDERNHQTLPFEELEDIFKGLPEKLFEKN
ncbi:hypothetical protein AB751O23_AL_00120 [Chlamydiales bacterium SCGC AB-751-O23]|jgi:hypothetical protein|nr:hypothetical protein AB751O23_AL_00120 [Chlamydiales bacterium SCGC AB-751-O23]